MKSETCRTRITLCGIAFQSTHSMKSETVKGLIEREKWRISIHSLNEEWDCQYEIAIKAKENFNPLTQWRVRNDGTWKSETTFDFNPLTQWRVRHTADGDKQEIIVFQSTHSMKSETLARNFCQPIFEISIHSLNEEWDRKHWFIGTINKNFNPLTQGIARPCCNDRRWSITNFNPLTQWRVRRLAICGAFGKYDISIHSLNEEWDC